MGGLAWALQVAWLGLEDLVHDETLAQPMAEAQPRPVAGVWAADSKTPTLVAGRVEQVALASLHWPRLVKGAQVEYAAVALVAAAEAAAQAAAAEAAAALVAAAQACGHGKEDPV